jgi:hypothetical protein
MNDAGKNPVENAPPTLGEAVEQFKKFLGSNGHPTEVRWVTRGDVIPKGPHQRWVHARSENQIPCAEKQYAQGLKKGLGIALRAVCSTETATFAAVFVPEDDLDAHCNLMPRGLEVSCPAEKMKAVLVKNPFWWRYLRLRYRRRIEILEL